MTLIQLAQLNKKNGGHFFDGDVLRGNRESLNNFRITKETPELIEVVRTHEGKDNTFMFSTGNGRLVNSWSVR
jgi:hypothetical protein